MYDIEALVRLNGDYCREICGQENSCARLKDGHICKDAQRYTMLRRYAKTGLSPDDIVELKRKYGELQIAVEHLRCSGEV